MYEPPDYLWAITIAGVAAVLATICVVLYGGAMRAGLGRRRAALLAGGAAAVMGGWFAASAVIAGQGWYHTRIGHGAGSRRWRAPWRRRAWRTGWNFRTRSGWPRWPS
jgi:hypothetical protein